MSPNTLLKNVSPKELNAQALTILIAIQCVLFILSSRFDSNFYIQTTQIIIDVIFTLDLLFRVKTHTIHYWKKPFNAIDAAIVIVSLLGHFILPNAQSLTVLRIIRLFRLFRLLKLIPNFEQIEFGLRQAIKASRGVFLMLLLLVSFFSILGFLLFHKSIPSHFSDPLVASYTVFSLFTVEGWNEVPSMVPSDSIDYYLIRTYVISVIIFGSFFALSLANAIFIDEMVMDNTSELEQKIDELAIQIESQSKQIEELKNLVEKNQNSS
ncbi:MAG: ion transporter [Vibrio sp.]